MLWGSLTTTLLVYAFGLLFVGSSRVAALTINKQIELGGHDYFLPPTPAWSLWPWAPNLTAGAEEYLPLTVIKPKSSDVTGTVLAAIFKKYNLTDDVWNPSFGQIIFVNDRYTSDDNNGDDDDGPRKFVFANDSIRSSAYTDVDKILYASDFSSPALDVPLGPYFLNAFTGKVFEAYRLYPDTNQAFLQASYQDPRGFHTNLKAATSSAGGLSIAVPSRLYFTPSPDLPLAGVRLAVKDLYDLVGMKTSGGNRALFEITTTANATAVPVQKLIDAGAIVVGKNKLSEFAFAGKYHLDHIDYLLPFNPRGDGYNSPGDSSGGSAASIAAYDWLDVSMGSDTGGSIRGPAVINGVFGNRPSWGAVEMKGVLPLSTSMDTSGTLCRDPILWAKVNKVLYAGYGVEYPGLPKKIYITGFGIQSISELNDTSPLGTTAYNFLQGLAGILGSNVTAASIDYTWNTSYPKTNVTANATIAEIVPQLYSSLTAYEQWINFGRSFIAKYQSMHNGELPYMFPNTLRGWRVANNSMTESNHQRDLQLKKVVEDFGNFLFPYDAQSCSDSILIYPSVQGRFYKPDFDPIGGYFDAGSHDASPWVQEVFRERDDLLRKVDAINMNCTIDVPPSGTASSSASSLTPPPPNRTNGVGVLKNVIQSTSPGRFASVAGLPDYALTVGQGIISTENNYSNRTMMNQSLPLGMNIIARRGCDFVVQNLISELLERGVIKSVKTGSSVY